MVHGPFARFWRDENGATAIEYSLIAAILGAGLVLGFGQVREGVLSLYSSIKDGMAF
jgi:pilus assembly protein Flp/PilA